MNIITNCEKEYYNYKTGTDPNGLPSGNVVTSNSPAAYWPLNNTQQK